MGGPDLYPFARSAPILFDYRPTYQGFIAPPQGFALGEAISRLQWWYEATSEQKERYYALKHPGWTPPPPFAIPFITEEGPASSARPSHPAEQRPARRSKFVVSDDEEEGEEEFQELLQTLDQLLPESEGEETLASQPTSEVSPARAMDSGVDFRELAFGGKKKPKGDRKKRKANAAGASSASAEELRQVKMEKGRELEAQKAKDAPAQKKQKQGVDPEVVDLSTPSDAPGRRKAAGKEAEQQKGADQAPQGPAEAEGRKGMAPESSSAAPSSFIPLAIEYPPNPVRDSDPFHPQILIPSLKFPEGRQFSIKDSAFNHPETYLRGVLPPRDIDKSRRSNMEDLQTALLKDSIAVSKNFPLSDEHFPLF